jgi:hypothetical protein
MKRVILSLTLALFMLGLILPPISHADDSATAAASSTRSAADKITPTRDSEIFPPKIKSGFLRPILERYLIIASPLIGIIVVDVEPPSLSDTPPGKKKISDRPDGDDNGWEDQLK